MDLVLNTQTAIELIANSRLRPMAYFMLISIYKRILISKLMTVFKLKLIPKMYLRSELILFAKWIFDHLVVAKVEEEDVEVLLGL